MDALLSADIVSDDPDGTAHRLVRALGLPEPRPSAVAEPPGYGFRAVWMRAHVSMKVSPTLIEVIGGRPATVGNDLIQERIGAQAPRPVRTHATVFVGDIDEVMARLSRKRIRHRVSPSGPGFDFPRVWIGVTDDDPLGYDAGVDAGLWAEVVPRAHSRIPEECTAPRDSAAAADPGTIVRVLRRRFLVPDLDRARRALDESLGLSATVTLEENGVRLARYAFDLAASAELELAEPGHAGELRDFAGRWGAGPHAIVLAVRDLDAFAERLRGRGTAVRFADEGAPRLLVEPAATGGTPFEAVEAESDGL